VAVLTGTIRQRAESFLPPFKIWSIHVTALLITHLPVKQDPNQLDIVVTTDAPHPAYSWLPIADDAGSHLAGSHCLEEQELLDARGVTLAPGRRGC
jgi:hypothetical protein